MDKRAFDHARAAALRAVTHPACQLIEREIALIGRTGKPLGGYPTDALAATDIHSVTAAGVTAGIKNLRIHGSNLHDGRRKTLLRPSTRHDQLGLHSSSRLAMPQRPRRFTKRSSEAANTASGMEPERGKARRKPGFQRS